MTDSAHRPALPQPTPGTRHNAWLAFALGLYFSILQFSYFFLLEAWVSSRAISFFFALFFWLCGFLIGLRQQRTRSLALLLALSLLCYYLSLWLVQQFPYRYSMFALTGTALLLSGLAPGYYFPWARRQFRQVKSLFLHENNGFILGIVITLFAAVFAGHALLTWGPLCALGLVLMVLWMRRGHETTPVQGTAQSPFVPTLLGLYFAVLQVALYLAVQVYYSATFTGYFLVVIAWMGGVVWGLRVSRLSLRSGLLVSLAAWASLLGSLSILSPYTLLLPWIGLLSACVGLPAGLLFRDWRMRLSSRALFLHENNGFIIGYLISILAFVQWGVGFLYWAPLLGFACVMPVAHARRETPASLSPLLLLTLLIPLSWLYGGTWVAWALLVALVLLLMALPARHYDQATSARSTAGAAWPAMSANAMRLTLMAAGSSLLLLQYLITREFSTILAASELAILIVAVAYFVGFSVGYGPLQRLSLRSTRLLAIALFFLHIGILLFAKPVAGALIGAGYGWQVLLGLLFVSALGTSAFFSMLLPRIIDAHWEAQGHAGAANALPEAYSHDLAGAIIGVLAMLAMVHWLPQGILPVYLLLLVLIIALTLNGSRLQGSFVAIGLVIVTFLGWYQTTLGTAATEHYYQSRGYQHATLRYSRQSLYHGIDVIDSYQDAAHKQPDRRISFLNGVRYFQYKNPRLHTSAETGLSQFTWFLAELPAKYQYQRKKKLLRILILGAGSMYSLQRVRHYAEKTTLVEIDPFVVESARKAWQDVNHLDSLNARRVEIVIDDARHYLMRTDEKFDLIVMDISAPYYLGTSLLHNREFFRLVKSRLKRDGIFAESTQSRPNRKRPEGMAMRILAAADTVFPYWNVIDTRGAANGNHGYVFAAKRNIVHSRQWRELLRKNGRDRGIKVYGRDREAFRLRQVRPFSLYNMDSLLTSNRYRISNRLRLGDSARHGWQVAAKQAGEAIWQVLSVLPKIPLLLSAALALVLSILLWQPLRVYLLARLFKRGTRG